MRRTSSGWRGHGAGAGGGVPEKAELQLWSRDELRAYVRENDVIVGKDARVKNNLIAAILAGKRRLRGGGTCSRRWWTT